MHWTDTIAKDMQACAQGVECLPPTVRSELLHHQLQPMIRLLDGRVEDFQPMRAHRCLLLYKKR
jgi:hypothetical protein